MSKKLKCVLLIDDDPAVNYLHEFIISKTGLTEKISIAETGNDGISLIKNALKEGLILPDLIFLDLNMPGMDGWEFLDEYKNLKSPSDQTPVILILTSSVNPEDQNRAKKYPSVSGYYMKPLTLDLAKDIKKKYFFPES